jgi:hypothetical protein
MMAHLNEPMSASRAPGHAGRRSAPRRARALVAVGGLVALVTGTVAASVATAAPPDTSGDGDHQAGAQDVSTGAFEACSANFGYGKVAEVVVKVNGVVPSPPLTYPANVQLVAEFTDGTGIHTCTPDVVTPALWDMHSPFGFVFGIDPPVGNYVFLPGDAQPVVDSAGVNVPSGLALPVAGVPVTLRLVGAPAGFTVSVGEAIVPRFEVTDAEVLAAAQPLMSTGAFNALSDLVNTGTGGGCPNPPGTGPDSDLTDAYTAIVAALEPPFKELVNWPAMPNCSDVGSAALVFQFQLGYLEEVGRQAVFELKTLTAAITFTG